MARVRSPNYPQISLPDAITRVANIFSKEHKHPAPREVIVKDMGYNGIHGNSLGALSALSKYGLLERDGQDYRVSERAIAIIHPLDEESKAAALREAAQAPALFAEIFEQFKGQLPSDENLRAYLIRKGFAESALTPVIDSLRETMQFVAGTPLHVTGSGALQTGADRWIAADHFPVSSGQDWVAGRAAIAVELVSTVLAAQVEERLAAFLRSVGDGTAIRAVS